MDLNKICIGIIVLMAILGISCSDITDQNMVYGANETWVKEQQSSAYISGLTATIHVHIKNNGKNVQYFKISQNYTGTLNESVPWIVDWTSPSASKMIKSMSPELGGDWGWKINPGETKEVTFKIHAIGRLGEIPSYISNAEAVDNIYWPLLNEPGLFASWFWPNEIETLNPTLDMKYWKGTFDFNLVNYGYTTVSGIIRGPIIPTNSKLVSATPKSNSFNDKNIYLNTNTVAWDVTIAPGEANAQHFQYVYEWPDPNSNTSSTGTYMYNIPKTAASTTSSIPTAETGLPYSLFIVGGIIAVGGVVYARFMR